MRFLALVPCALFVLACSESAPEQAPVSGTGGGGAASMSANGGTAVVAAAGMNTVTPGSGGMAQGMTSQGGQVAVAGAPAATGGTMSTGGMPNAAAGMGATMGGMGNAMGGAGTGGASAGAVMPSEGCGKGGRPAGGEVAVDNDHIYDFPESYDGTTPMPLVIALHGANNPNTILQTLSNGSRLEENFVRAFPKSNGNAWRYENGTGADSMRISAIYDELLANYCIDVNRVFLTGHSSGAQMSVQMLCADGGDPRFKAVAPVAASKYCDTLSPVPVLYIQGMMDAQRGGSDGADVVEVFRTSNGCMDTSTPYAPIMGCNSEFDGQPVDPGCIEYAGCSVPTIWCSHNDNNYNNTDGRQHGWPCFASDAIADFFLGLP